MTGYLTGRLADDAGADELLATAEKSIAVGKRLNVALERSIDVQVTRLRRKIEEDPKLPLYLQTVRGVGYVLVPDRG